MASEGEAGVFTEGKERTVWVWSRGGGHGPRKSVYLLVPGLSYFLCKEPLSSRTLYILWAR